MELYGKSLIYTVFLIVILLIVQFLIEKYQNKSKATKENFVDNIGATYIQNMVPNEGDSSTMVTLKGVGFKFVSKIYFFIDKTTAQAIILNNRSDTQLEILPPPITELGKSLVDIRRNITEKQEGLKVGIYFVRGNPETGDDMAFNPDDDNVVKVENLHFYYIDKLPYQNNCPLPPPPPATDMEAAEPAVTDSLPDEIPIQYPEGSDLEFLNKILPEKEKKLQDLYNSIIKNLDKYDKLNTNQVEELEKIQALESLEEIKKQFNYERYVITQTLLKDLKK
jgi:hypothetical protein